MNPQVFLSWLTGLSLLMLPGQPAWSAPGQADVKKAELSELKGRIEALKADVVKGEADRADVADQLREIEQAISDSSRRLRQLSEAQGAAQAELASLQQQSANLEKQIGAQQGQLGSLLHRQYVAGESDTLRRFLGGDDPNEPARDAVYMRILSQAKADWLTKLRNALREKSRLAAAVRAKSEELAKIEVQSRSEQAELLAQQKKRKSMLERISVKLKGQRREIDSLKRDESRLSKLIQGLTRIVKKPKPVPQPNPAPKPQGGAAEPKPAPQVGPAPEPAPPEPTPTGVSFASLKGRLVIPLRGELLHRFGTRRAEGGASWKGWFIRAAGGDVRAVAPGRVVFADWLRGFGNLLILDHGDEYLTVYGNNESLYKSVGDAVKAGEAIAAVGSSGGNAETGLYFELRFQGLAMDPQKWMNTK